MAKQCYRTNSLLYAMVFCAALFFLNATWSYAAEFNIITSDSAPSDGLIHLEVIATTDQQHPLNAAEGILTFPPDIFKVSSISTNNSIFSLWTIPPSDSGNGAISFAGGTPALGGFIFTGILFDIALEPLRKGDATFTINDGAILAHDGIGTDILDSVVQKNYRIEDAVPETYDSNGDGTVSIEELSIGLTET